MCSFGIARSWFVHMVLVFVAAPSLAEAFEYTPQQTLQIADQIVQNMAMAVGSTRWSCTTSKHI